MKKKILFLGLILAAAFVLFTSCDPMAMAERMLNSYTITGYKYGSGLTAELKCDFSKALGMGTYDLTIKRVPFETMVHNEAGVMKIKGLFEKELALSKRSIINTSLTGKSQGSIADEKFRISKDKEVVIEGFTFDLSSLM